MAGREFSEHNIKLIIGVVIATILIFFIFLAIFYFSGKSEGHSIEKELCSKKMAGIEEDNLELVNQRDICITELNQTKFNQTQLDICLEDLAQCNNKLETPDNYEVFFGFLKFTKKDIEIILNIILIIIPISIAFSLFKITLNLFKVQTDKKSTKLLIGLVILLSIILGVITFRAG